MEDTRMTDVYKECPSFENDRYLIRFVDANDADDLLEVYSDKNALPFFNSDNCDGDNFYYPTKEKMQSAINFWLKSYETKWFVMFAIIDKAASKAIGTAELFHREANDAFNGVGVLRLDVKSGYEKEEVLLDMLSLIVPPAFELFDCGRIITKALCYAVERIEALKKYGFEKSDELLIGTNDKYAYNGYWVINK